MVLEITGANITVGDARLEPHVVMRSLIAGIVITKLRTLWRLIPFIGMTFLGMKLKLLYVPCVAQNKMFNKNAKVVGFAWANTFVRSANSLMMMSPRNNTTVMNVGYAELEAKKTSFIVTSVDVATQN